MGHYGPWKSKMDRLLNKNNIKMDTEALSETMEQIPAD